MKIVMILVPVMLVLVALGIVLFSWAVKNGQYDDLDGPAHRILYDDDKDKIPDDAKQPQQQTASRDKRSPVTKAEDDNPGDDQTS
ncbi:MULTISPECIES: cbb3-type cytochrome oxidase assembly protein CcoS [Marinobacter]|uniref:cbb3-type cytochrome oxidase assembly protein CcoS n=1 Tax=Marinobacter TaxID=2742 RepID=UPI00124561FE|nr:MULTISPECIES: cbb3-type cytochrome oxidase assembly protein CcoS [Marinobacter]MDX1554019.1 cbb3-type cytochrome oxidase assembly protein CcoS [Marinobacter sp.]